MGKIRGEKIFPLNTTGGRTTTQLLIAGKYGSVSSLIDEENFPMRPLSDGPRRIMYLEYDADPGLGEVLVEAKRKGLHRPMYEDALFFGEQCTLEEREAWTTVFLHDPLVRDCGHRLVIVLKGRGQYHSISLGYLGHEITRGKIRYALVL